jgi:hypothetical protein
VAVATIAGLAGSAATALILVFPGDVRIWTVASVLASTALVLGGKYAGVERVAVLLAAGLGIAAVAAAVSVGPDFGGIAGGTNPASTGSVEFGEILPWLGFMLSGAAGMIWYSYWLRAKGYGAAAAGTVEPSRLSPSDRGRLRGWLVQMTLDNTVAVAGTLVITMAFLVLGAELLQPEGLVPEEQEIAEVLGELLGGVWGRAGFWFMVAAVFIGFWDTVLSDQDGFGRMFANGSRRVLERFGLQFGETVLMRAFVIVLLTALPVALYLVVGEPVTLLKAAGVIEAAHIPVVAGIVLYMNRSRLPDGLRPSLPVTVATAAAGAFFAIFALLYVWIEFA